MGTVSGSESEPFPNPPLLSLLHMLRLGKTSGTPTAIEKVRLLTSSSETGSGTASAPSCAPSSAALSSRRRRLLTSCSCRRALLRAGTDRDMSPLPGAGHPTQEPHSSLNPGGNCPFLLGQAREARAGMAESGLRVEHTKCEATAGIMDSNTGQRPEEQLEGPEAGFHTGSSNH